MRPNDDNPDENYTTELNERTKSGGGCAELWEETSRYRNNGEGNSGFRSEDNRRSFLKRVASGLAVALTPLGFSRTASASHQPEYGDRIEVVAPSGGVVTREECCVMREAGWWDLGSEPCWDGTRYDGQEGLVVGECDLGFRRTDRYVFVAWDSVCTACDGVDQHDYSYISEDNVSII